MAPNDAEINDLKVQLEAYRTKLSLLQQEVSVILDQSDKIEFLRAQELDEVSKARDRLKTKLQKYKAYVKQLERERDDLRDSVTEFVDKVESNPSALKLWPRSHIELRSFLDPVTDPLDRNDVSVDTSELLSYAAARITSLTQQRDLERQNFKQLQHLFEGQIRTLRAQVARRDATIAAFHEHTSHRVGNLTPSQDTGIRNAPSVIPLSDEQIIQALRRTMENNHVLEAEIRVLDQKLQEAKLASVTPIPTSSTTSKTTHVPLGSQNPELNVALGYEETLVNPGRLNLKHSEAQTIFHPSHSPSTPVAPLNNTELSNRPHVPQIDALDHQIAYLSSQIDAFKKERDLLKEILVLQKSEPSSDGVEQLALGSKFTHEPSPHISPELQSELQAPRDTALTEQQGPQTLEDETSCPPNPITRHLDALWPQTPTNKTDPLPDVHEDFDGEISMELATPLTPSNIVLPDGIVSRSSRVHSPVDSNESPRMIRPRILPSPLPLSTPNSPTERTQPLPPFTPLISTTIGTSPDPESQGESVSDPGQ